MATDAQLEALFERTALAATNANAENLSATNVPDVRNMPSSELGSVVDPAMAARRADLEAVRRPGVPLDTESGAPAGTRFRLAFTDNTPDQIKTLQAKYGMNNIAVSPSGQLVIRNLLDESTGQVRDILVDEENMSAKDLLDLSGAIPEVIGAVVALRGAGRIPKVGQAGGKAGFARDLIAGSVGAQVGAEAAQRALAESTSDLTETLGKRAKGAAVDAGFNLLTAGGAKLARGLPSRISGPLSGNQTAVQIEGLQAADRLRKATGIGIPFTIGEETGSPLVMRAEALMKKVPGSSGTMEAETAAAEDALRKIQSSMLEGRPMPSELGIGIDAIDQLKRAAAPIDEATAAASREVSDVASAEIRSAFDELTIPSRQMFNRPVGQAIRTRANSDLADFKARSRALYDEVYSTPGGRDAIIPTSGLRSTAKEIRDALPKKTEIIEEITVDTYGSPIVRTTTGKEVLREFVPPNLRKFVDELASGLDPKMPLNEVVQMRQIVNDAISQADVLPGIGTRFLKKVSRSLTEAIEKGVEAAPDPTLADKLKAANAFYREGRPKFERAGITEIFRSPDAPGYVGDAQIVKRIASGEVSADRYFDFRDFLGKDSEQFKMLKRAILDDIYYDSRIVGSGQIIDAADFLKRIKNLDREVQEDLIGPQGQKMLRTAHLLGSIQGKVDLKDLDALLASGDATSDAIRKLIAAQQKQDSLYANTVIKKFVKGETGTESIKPEEFVGRYLDVAKTPGEIEEVMSLLSDAPSTTEAIRRKTLERFFAESKRNPTPLDLTRNASGDPTQIMSGQALLKALGDETKQAKLRAVLGSDTMEMLRDFIRVQSILDTKTGAAATVGGLVGGGILGRLVRLDFKDALDIAKYKLVAATLANPAMRGWLTRQSPRPDTAAIGRALIASGPVLQAFGEEFSDVSGVAAAINELNSALERSAGNQDGQKATQPVSDQDLDAIFR